MEQAISAVKLITWPGWGVIGSMTVLCALLIATLALLLPFPSRGIAAQLNDPASRADLAARLGLAPISGSALTAIRQFNAWLDEWFGTPFSSQAFERCLAIAFVYPVSLFLITLVINGVQGGNAAFSDFALFMAAAVASALIAYLLLGFISRFVRRLWVTLGGDNDLAAVLMRVVLGMFAVVTAFAIAFAIASVISSDLYGAQSVVIAVVGAFALALALAITFAFAGAQIFALAVLLIAAAGLVFASKFAFVLLLFFVIIPIVNACVDWLSWALTRTIMARAAHLPSNLERAGILAAALTGAGLIAALLVVVLTALLANALELLNSATTLAGDKGFNWKPLVEKAASAPWTQALFITGMVLTPLLPVFLYLIMGFAGALARFTPNSAETATAILQYRSAQSGDIAVRHITWTVMLSRLWYVAAIAAAILVFALFTIIANAAGLQITRFLTDIAYCATAWRHGQCL